MRRDYLRDLKIDLVDAFGSTRVLGKDTSVFFGGLTPETVRAGVNAVMETAVPYYATMAERAGQVIPETDILEVSLKVVLSYLYMYHGWRNTSPEYKERPLMLNDGDLSQQNAKGVIYFYFKRKYQSGGKAYAAALMGLSSQQFDSWLKAQERHALSK